MPENTLNRSVVYIAGCSAFLIAAIVLRIAPDSAAQPAPSRVTTTAPAEASALPTGPAQPPMQPPMEVIMTGAELQRIVDTHRKISLPPGQIVLTEPLRISHPLVMAGAGTATVIVGSHVSIEASDVCIRDLMRVGGGFVIGTPRAQANNTRLENVRVDRAPGDGVRMLNGNCCHLDVAITACQGHGINVEYGGPPAAIDNNRHWIKVNVTGCNGAGIRVHSGAANTLFGTSQGNKGGGLWLNTPDNNIDLYTEGNDHRGALGIIGTKSAFGNRMRLISWDGYRFDNNGNDVSFGGKRHGEKRGGFGLATASDLHIREIALPAIEPGKFAVVELKWISNALVGRTVVKVTPNGTFPTGLLLFPRIEEKETVLLTVFNCSGQISPAGPVRLAVVTQSGMPE